MTDGVEVKVEGLEALGARLRGLSEGMRKKGVRAAVRKGANQVRDAARAGAQKVNDAATPEEIAKNIAVSFNGRLYRQAGDVGFRIGVRGGARDLTKYGEFKGKAGGNPGGDTWYWRFIEFGTSRTQARPFLRPALESNTEKVLSEVVAEMTKQLDRFAKKGAS